MYTIPANQQQYIRAGQIQQGLVLNQSAMSPNNQQVVAEEATRKREMRLMKNRLVIAILTSCISLVTLEMLHFFLSHLLILKTIILSSLTGKLRKNAGERKKNM